MTTKEGRDSIYLVWKKTTGKHRNFLVGQLSRGDGYEFRYGLEVAEAREGGFAPLISFPDWNKTYQSNEMFPVFSSRLPDRKRRDMDEILAKYQLAVYDEFELLKRSSARLPIDTLEFVDPIFPENQEIVRQFYLAGTRHYLTCAGKQCREVIPVKVGDEVFLKPEPTNDQDLDAIQVYSAAEEILGYIPRYFSKAILPHLSALPGYRCKVLELTQLKNCSECIFVQLEIPPR